MNDIDSNRGGRDFEMPGARTIFTATIVICAMTTAFAEEPVPPLPEKLTPLEKLMQRIDAQDREIAALKSIVLLNQNSNGEQVFSQPVSQGSIFVSNLAEESDDPFHKNFDVKVGGRIMWDGTYGTDSGLQRTSIGRGFENGHEFRRARIYASGEGFGIFDYKIQIDFASFNNPVGKDVFIGAEFPIGHLRVGHFKEPFSLDELMSSRNLTFMERALPNAMVPSRSAGMMLFDRWADGNGTWFIGSFWDDLQQIDTDDDGNVDNADSEPRSINVRVTRLLHEDCCGESLVHIGGGFRYVNANGNVGFSARPEIHDTFRILGVNTGVETESYYQYGLELASVWGPLSFQSEYIATSIQNSADSFLQGGYFFASYFLTGEHRPYDKEFGVFGRVHPHENFWWVDSSNDCDHGLGAWEVALRFSWLDYNDSGLTSIGGTSGAIGRLTNWTAGVNWYWNPQMRMMFNLVRSEFDDVATGRDAVTHAFLTRMQIDF